MFPDSISEFLLLNLIWDLDITDCKCVPYIKVTMMKVFFFFFFLYSISEIS